MNIFIKIKNAIYNPDYYKEVVQKPFSYSFKYLLVFALLFALVASIVLTVKFIPVVKALQEKAPELANYFPQELTINIKNGEVSTNVQEPYFVKMPQDWEDSSSHYKNFENQIVINTKDKFDINTFKSYKTAMLLTSDSVIYYSENQIAINSLNNIKDFTLNRQIIADLINKFKPLINILFPILFIAVFFIGFFMVVWKMVYLLFGALIIWLIAKIKGLKIGYKGSYKAGMQLITGPIVLVGILSAISPNLTFKFLFTILLIILALVNLKKTEVQAV